MQTTERRSIPTVDFDSHAGSARPIADTRLAERFSAAAIAAWQGSFFAKMPPGAAMRILASGVELSLAAGDYVDSSLPPVGRGLDGDAHCALVIEGLIRIYVKGCGRQVTQRYVGPGFTLGIPAMFAANPDSESQAVTDTTVLRLRSEVIRTLAARDPRVAMSLCQVLAGCVFENAELLSGNVFRPLRERVARHLLDLSERDPQGRLVVHANPQDIADATGTVREVVTRVVKRMREEGMVVREGRNFVLPNPAALHRVAEGDRIA
jgi:CRP-like cAMP-binding protein